MLRKLIKKEFDRIVYSSPVVNRILRNINKGVKSVTSFRLRPYGILRVKAGNVQFKMATNETSYVTKQLFWKGPENFEYTPIFQQLIRKCRSFVDIGANTGYYSLLAAKTNPTVVVHAFEPASGPLHFLQKNVKINNLEERVFIHPIALSNNSGQVEFFEIINPVETFAKYNLSGVGGLKKTHQTQEQSVLKEVPAKTLDDYSRTMQLPYFDLIKIDTEGTEDLVLEGASAIIEQHKPIIVCETLFNKIEVKLDAIMKKHGYLFFNHLNGKLDVADTLVRTSDNGVTDCFFVHPEKIKFVQDFIAEQA